MFNCSLQVQPYHVFREANSIADRIASLGLGHDYVFASNDHLLQRIRGAIGLDCRSFPRVRVLKQ